MVLYGWILVQLLLVVVASHAPSAAGSSVSRCHDDEREALLSFKKGFVIDYYDYYRSRGMELSDAKTESWNRSRECCEWDGVKCDYRTGHVVKLDLIGSGLKGSFPGSNNTLYLLRHLRYLSLAGNPGLYGQVPREIGWLSHLKTLDLSYNLNLSNDQGQLKMPDFPTIIANLTHLEYLDLSYVSIASNLPPILFTFSQLTHLDLSGCGLVGEFPSRNVNTTMLGQIYLSDNNLTGIIPGSIFTLPFLNYLNLEGNLFTGIAEFKFDNDSISRTSLTEFTASYNYLSGQVPQEIGLLSHLTTLDLSNNFDPFGNINLKMPKFNTIIANLTHLKYLDLSYVSIASNLPPILFTFSQLKMLASIYLSGCGLVGEFPSRNVNTTMLGQIDLSFNNLTGIIPGSIFTLPFLQHLYLDHNLFTGIAEFKFDNDSISRTSLTHFRASFNRLQGKIPDAIFDLHNLQHLSLWRNNLTETIPLSRIHKLHNLNQLYLSHNNLSIIDDMGPDSTPSWPSFNTISMSSCNLGHFPTFLKEQRNLQILDLSHNHIHGVVPHWFLNVSTTSLINLDLSHNSLSGGLEMLPWKNLGGIDIGYNLLHSVVPVPYPTTMNFIASNNQLTGVIPPSLCNIDALMALDLAQNNLTGNIPDCFTSFANLIVLSLRGNKLEGRIPQSLSNCLQLQFLDLSSNKLNDIFPHWLGVLPALRVLVLSSNNLQGSLMGSNTTKAFSVLQILDVSHNNLTGNLPSDLVMSMKAMSIKVLTTSHEYLYMDGFVIITDNSFSIVVWYKGIIRRLDAILESMVLIDVSKNGLQGPIPDAIGDLVSLRSLNLDHNNFSGHIPSSLGNLTLLESLDLSYNRLGGCIPSELVNMKSLEVFNVSENDLVGHVPTGKQFDTFLDNSYQGNPGLCGPYLTKKCTESNSAPNPAGVEGSNDESLDLNLWEIGLMGCGCGMLVGLAWGYLIFWKMTPYWVVRLILKIETLVMVHHPRRHQKNRR